MDQTAILLSWKTILWIVLGTGTISAALLAFVGWLLSRSTKFLDSYTAEIAKALAKRQNLDALIEETRKLTNTAETIKAQLSHENWDRQTRWTAKRNLYCDTQNR